MIPVLFRFPEWIPLLGGQAITSFGVLLLAAFLAAGALFARGLRASRPDSRPWELVVTGAVAGLVGAKVLHLAVHAALGLPGGGLGRGGLDWFGGLALGAGAVLWQARKARLSLALVAGAAAPALALGYAIGRVGSFLVGADYGLPTTLPWGVAFTAGAPPTTPANMVMIFGADPAAGAWSGEHVRVHPTQLYEAALSLGILAWLLKARARGWAALAWFLILSGTARAVVEPLRAKRDVLFGPVTVDLILALATVMIGLYLRGRRKEGASIPQATEPA